MSLFRSSFFIAIVSLFVLSGYAHEVLGDCCAHEQQEQTDHAGVASDKTAPDQPDGCQCLCHQVISPFTAEPVRVAAVDHQPAEYVAHAGQFPPDAVPVGIDHPPQLA